MLDGTDEQWEGIPAEEEVSIVMFGRF